jgi:hypothetical protein
LTADLFTASARIQSRILAQFFFQKNNPLNFSAIKIHFFSKDRSRGTDIMTGGFCMYIPSYQIHNVLNVYRKQLTRGTVRTNSGGPDRSRSAQDRIEITAHGQRQSLFDKISSEIVQRITQFDPSTVSKTEFSGQSTETRWPARGAAESTDEQDPAFTYTLIDRHNQKSTHNLSVRQLYFSTKNMETLNGTESDSDTNPVSE